ncbi:dihydrofolate reductase family protein [Allobranchiibius sp. CTAmp26]|uniref:dihydrofolate reductase family protein n=1 Tax=Allobranchiibius sp. CTAmp26 TaxID=2815214 RepID=UPI001AA17CC9|nr:dihydrofolate reductase family protein [Allobranchiibius sp. CTAmp26]MBO1755530.1 dihydrofolate reductase family protein [Allobranchiibius sp. CTAmp26]
MTRIVIFTLSTLDGAVDDPGRYFPNADADGPSAPGYDEVMCHLEHRLIGSQKAVLLGRGMYEEWSRYWPTSDEQPFADFINTVPKYVLSSTDLTSRGWPDCHRVSGALVDVVDRLRRLPGDGDVGVHGSVTLVQSLLAEGLADELQLAVAPVVDPQGRRLFGRAEGIDRWELAGCTPTETGALWLTYRPRGTS